jgi:hypothetical protein
MSAPQRAGAVMPSRPSGEKSVPHEIVHRAFLAAAQATESTAAHNLVRMATVARTLDVLPAEKWEQAIPFTFRIAEVRIPPAEPSPIDPFYLVNTMQGLMRGAGIAASQDALPLIQRMAAAHGMRLDWQDFKIHIEDEAPTQVVALLNFWKRHAEAYEPALRRALARSLEAMRFPQIGSGQTATLQMTFLGILLALMRLALMSEAYLRPDEIPAIVQTKMLQTIADLFDHHDPAFLLIACQETGWLREARLRALVGDAPAPAKIAA